MFLDRWTPVRRGVAALVLMTFSSFVARDLLVPSVAWAATAREELTKAEDYFQVADFQTALEKVDVLLKSGDLEGTLLRDAYILKARSELGLAHRSASMDAFCNALKVDPAWRPDPDFYTNDEMQTFEQSRASCSTAKTTTPVPVPVPPATSTGTQKDDGAAAVSESKPWYKKPLILGVIGAALIGGVALAAGGGGDDGDEADLASFPEPPQ